jgi:hypothetical protein
MTLQVGIRRIAAGYRQQQSMVNALQSFVPIHQVRPVQLGRRNGTSSARRIPSIISLNWTSNVWSQHSSVRMFMVPAMSTASFSTLPTTREQIPVSGITNDNGNSTMVRSISLNLECGILEEDDDGYVFKNYGLYHNFCFSG